MAFWTFITNHGAVLALIAQHRQITAREIAGQLGITQRSVVRIIGDLEAEGYLRRTKRGRLNWYRVDRRRPLRRPEVQAVSVGKLLDVLVPPPQESPAVAPLPRLAVSGDLFPRRHVSRVSKPAAAVRAAGMRSRA